MKRLLDENNNGTLGAAVLGLGLTVYFLMFSGVIQRLFTHPSTTAKAQFANTATLKKGDPVRMRGVTVGKVKAISLDRGAASSTVLMELTKSASPIYRDATATVQFRTLLGANFTVNIDPGRPSSKPLGDGTIPMAQTSNQVELDDITDILRKDPRIGMRSMFHELPKVTQDPQVFATTVGLLAKDAPSVGRAVHAVRGVVPGDDIPALVTTANRTVQALNTPDDALRTVVSDAGTTLHTTATREADVRATLRQGAAIMPEVSATVRQLDATLTEADPLVASLRRSAADVGPTLQQVHPVVNGLNDLLGEARPLLDQLQPTAVALRGVATQGSPLIAQLSPNLARIGRQILPDLARVSPESQHATYEMIGPTASGLVAAASHFDAQGRYARLLGGGGARAVDTLPCRALFTDPNATELLKCQSLDDALHTYFNYTPTSPPAAAAKKGAGG